MDLKISVLSSGSVLLDGEPTGLANLAEAIRKAESPKDCVLYYRENPAGEPPPVSSEVLKLVIAKKLPVSFSTKPDFSDFVDAQGRSRPRDASGSPLQSIFAEARRIGLAIVQPSGQLAAIPLPPASKKIEEMIKTLPKIFGSNGSSNLAAIASTGFVPPGQRTVSLEEASRGIPFAGFLVGFVYAGHKVWIFEGDTASLDAGLAESDTLLVDSAMVPSLRPDWMQVARKVMRPGARVYLHDRAGYKIRRIVPSGTAPGWRDCEPEGERSYANCLLTTLATSFVPSVVVSSGTSAPNLAELTQHAEELDWIAGLPFRYDQLDTSQVIANLVAFSGGAKDPDLDEWTFSPVLVSAKGNRKPVFFFRWRSRMPKQILEITRK